MNEEALTLRIFIVTMALLVALCSTALAQIRGEVVEYKQGDTIMEGYIAYDNSIKGKRPGVLVIHDWTGISPYVRARAHQLASLGYVAFAPDIYGKGIRPANQQEAAQISSTFKNDRLLLRLRVNAGLDILKSYPLVDPDRLGAIGYCFGGMTALELARSGAALSGVVSFHGNLDTPRPEDDKNIHAKVLILQGSSDPVVPQAQLAAFQDEMSKAGVDWQLNIYSGTGHNFTNPDDSQSYNREADKRSFEAMKLFFHEIFGM